MYTSVSYMMADKRNKQSNHLRDKRNKQSNHLRQRRESERQVWYRQVDQCLFFFSKNKKGWISLKLVWRVSECDIFIFCHCLKFPTFCEVIIRSILHTIALKQVASTPQGTWRARKKVPRAEIIVSSLFLRVVICKWI